MLLERVVQSKETRKIFCVCDQCCPYYIWSVLLIILQLDRRRPRAFSGVHHSGGIRICGVRHATSKLIDLLP